MTTTDPLGARGKTPCKKCGTGTFFGVCGSCEPIAVTLYEYEPDDDDFSEEGCVFE